MATYFFDIDGVIFRYGSNQVLENSQKKLAKLKQQGNTIILTTARKPKDNQPPQLNIENTIKALKDQGIPFDQIIHDVESPRIIINDEGAYYHNQWRNQPLPTLAKDDDFGDTFNKNHVTCRKVFNSLAAIGWTAVKYSEKSRNPFDADEYYQTIMIAISIINNKGIDHIDIVKRFRQKIKLKSGLTLSPGGVGKSYKGQLSKLAASSNQQYLANDGASDGAAMRTAAIASFYCNNFKEMIIQNDLVARITHASNEARMSACLTTIRLRQSFHPYKAYSPSDLIRELISALNILKLSDQSSYFMKKCILACKIIESYSDPAKQLALLAVNIGMEHLCWSTPISAVFWTFHGDCRFKHWLNHENENSLLIPVQSNGNIKRMLKVDASMYSQRNRKEDERYLKHINEYNSFMKCHGYHYNKSMDIDTFFSIAFSILAAINGTDDILPELGEMVNLLGHDLFKISGSLLSEIT